MRNPLLRIKHSIDTRKKNKDDTKIATCEIKCNNITLILQLQFCYRDSKTIVFKLKDCPDFIHSCEVTLKIENRDHHCVECKEMLFKKGESYAIQLPENINSTVICSVDIQHIEENQNGNQTLFFL